MIFEVELSNGYGDHVEMIVEARCEDEAKRLAVADLKRRAPHQRNCGLNGDEPDMVKVHLLTANSGGILKLDAFNHETGGFF